MTAIEKTILTFIAAENDADRQRAAQEAKAFLRMMNNSPPSDAPAKDDAKMVRTIRATLTDIGVPHHIKGFNYTVEGIRLCINDPDLIQRITKGLYPEVAKTFNTTASRVERAIRHAIEVANDCGDTDTLTKYFGNSINCHKCKPTNAQFIATISGYIKERM